MAEGHRGSPRTLRKKRESDGGGPHNTVPAAAPPGRFWRATACAASVQVLRWKDHCMGKRSPGCQFRLPTVQRWGWQEPPLLNIKTEVTTVGASPVFVMVFEHLLGLAEEK